ncbi:Hypothetical protein HVR_LOCUS690 [uncultured virus]|nr:Hypothetical protein HVR_LOCUS690 [uncultured virus]
MGFHAVAFGLHVGHTPKNSIVLRLIAKSVHIISDDEEKIPYDFSYEPEGDVIIDIQLHDDIITYCGNRSIRIYIDELNKLIFMNAKNNKIRIGMAHCCAYMIYLGCVGDDLGGVKDPVIIEEDTLSDLFEFQKKLVEQGRLSVHVKLQLTGNCCS